MPFVFRTSSGQPDTMWETNLLACCLAAWPSRETDALSSMTLRSGSRFHVGDAVESLQDHAVEVARHQIQYGRLEETRTIVKTDRRPGFEAERVLLRVHVEIGRENGNFTAPERLAGEKKDQEA